jgi:Kazal-type serine protease inhibitor domain
MLPRSIAVVVAVILAVLAARIDAAGAAGIGETCAGTAGIGCNAGLWCELDAGRCGNAAAEGRCARAPQACNMMFLPVCACTGKTYSNDCARRSAKAQKAHNGPCGVNLRRPRVEPDATKGQ